MNKDFRELLKSINDGKVKGSQKKLADMLGLSKVAISQWSNGVQKPSIDNIEKMAQLFNIPEKKLQKIFVTNNGRENKTTISINVKDNEIELLKEKLKIKDEQIKFLEEQIKFYKGK